MILELIKLRIHETTRSSVWNKNVIINIVLGIFMLYMVVNFLVLGLFLSRALREAFPDSNPVELVNRALIYYFGVELLVRFFMQQTPAMSITPFLHLPVKRSFLMRFLLARSIVNPVNYVSFLIFIPFAVMAVIPGYSGAAACWWLLSIFLSVIFIIYLNVYIKRQMAVKPLVSLLCGLAYLALLALDYFGIFSVASLFNAVLQQPLWMLVPAALAVGAFLLNYRFLIIHAYPEEIDRSKKKQAAVQHLGFLSRFGQIGELMGAELKLILRNKRTKSVFYMSIVFLLYGLLIYPNAQFNGKMMWLMFVGIFTTGLAMLSYGNFIIAWEGKFFDGILTRESSFFDYVRAKYYLLASFCLVSYVLTIPYVFFGMKILWFQTACFLFNIGVNVFIMLWFAQYNRKRIDLSQSGQFNWQGTGVTQFIVMLPAILLPILIAFIFKWIGLIDWGLGVLALLGVIGIICHKWMIQLISRRLIKAKYDMAEGFRSNY